MTDTSEMPHETPDVDRDEDAGRMTVTPHTANRTLFGKSTSRSRTPGRGELPRGNRDKVRKRRRQQSDRDVGSVRPRLAHESDGSDSEWEGELTSRGSSEKGAGSKRGIREGWFGGFLTAIGNHPTAPTILAKWLQLCINMLLVGVVLWVGLAILNTVRSDLTHATERARSEMLNQMSQCETHFLANRCAPKADRLPALAEDCDRWEACMNQDQDAVMRVQISARNFAEIVNEFVGIISWKAWVSTVTPSRARSSTCMPACLSLYLTPALAVRPLALRRHASREQCGLRARTRVSSRVRKAGKPVSLTASGPTHACESPA